MIGLIPAPYRLLAGIAAAAVVASVIAGGGWKLRDISAKQEVAALELKIAQIEQAHAQSIAAAAQQVQALEQQARKAEQETTQALERIADADRKIEAEKRARATERASAAAERLHITAKAATDALVSRMASSAALAGSSPTIDPTPDVLSDLLGRCADRVVELARTADESAARGRVCEASYDKVRAIFSGGADP